MCKLYVVGIGAGSYDMLTVGAVRALESAEVICGYTEYVKLIRPYFPDKEYIATPMMQEVERCRIAVESAKSGRPTAMICSRVNFGFGGILSAPFRMQSIRNVQFKSHVLL